MRMVKCSGIMFILTLVCVVSINGQGLFFDKGRSGFYLTGGFCKGNNTYSETGVEIGWVTKGDANLGLRLNHASISETLLTTGPVGQRKYYNIKNEVWNPGFFFTEYPLRRLNDKGQELVLSLHQSLSWLALDMPPFNNTLRIVQIGGGVAYSVPVEDKIRFYLSGAFTQSLPQGKPSYGTFEIDLSLRVPFRKGSFVFGPAVAFSEDITAYGFNVGLMSGGLSKKLNMDF